jgi:hypothetical protein
VVVGCSVAGAANAPADHSVCAESTVFTHLCACAYGVTAIVIGAGAGAGDCAGAGDAVEARQLAAVGDLPRRLLVPAHPRAQEGGAVRGSQGEGGRRGAMGAREGDGLLRVGRVAGFQARAHEQVGGAAVQRCAAIDGVPRVRPASRSAAECRDGQQTLRHARNDCHGPRQEL